MRSGGLVPNRGGGPSRYRAAEGRGTCVLSGPLRFVDRRGKRAAMRVEDGNALGRRFVGQTVTLDLSAAQIGAADRDGDGAITPSDLLSGERVSVSVRLARDADALPALLEVRRVSVWHAPADA